MWLAALVPVVATALGTALGLGAQGWRRVVEPVRSFALAAVTVTIAVHLMPDAVEAAGPWALAIFAAGLLVPSLLGWIGARLRHARLAVELTFVGVIAHQVGDGLALGVLGGRWDFLVAMGAHTVPLAAVLAIAFADQGGRGRALRRAVVIALAPLLGLGIVRAGADASAAPWLDAAVSGLLLHVLAHDLPGAHGRTPALRTAELVAIAVGAALPLVAGHHEEGLAARIPRVLGELALAAAPALLVGIVLGAVVHAAARRAEVRWLAGGHGVAGALRGAVLGVPLPPCSCDIVPAARDLRERGGGAAFVTAFALAAPELGGAAVLLTVALLGWQLALIRLAAGLAIAVAGGLVVERLGRDRGGAPSAGLPPGPGSLLDGIDDRVAHDGAWVVVGLVVAAFVVAAVPPTVLGGARALVVAIAVAVPLTVSATAATPIAAALVATGLSPGAGIAAVLLGSMLNLTTLGFVRRVWRPAAAAGVTAVAVGIAVVVALGVDAAGVRAAPMARAHGAAAWIALAILGALAAASLWRHGLAHWLAALRGSDHGHDHAHAHVDAVVAHCDHHHDNDGHGHGH